MEHETISKLAPATGVGIETIRFYERGGLLDQPRRTLSNYRLYPLAEEIQLGFITHAKNLGFSRADIRELLQLQKGGQRFEVRDLLSDEGLVMQHGGAGWRATHAHWSSVAASKKP